MDVKENANESDSGTEDNSIEEEEIEPKFKYKRIGKDLKTILKSDVVTCSAVHPKFLIFGTFLGRVYLLDHDGNSVASNLNTSSNSIEFQHTVAVNHVDLNERGDYMATCSDDGKVNVTGLFSSENNQNLSLGKSIKAVSLDPDPKAIPGKRFIVGDDKLTLYEKTFFKKLKTTQLSTAEGYVLSVSWCGSFVAWASHLGVRVYDLNEKCSLGLIKWEQPNNARLENYRCNFRWSNATTLLIGWVDTVRICVIRKRNAIEAASRNLPGFIVDPISTFQTEFYICGLAPLTNTQIVVLGYPKEKDEERKALRSVFCVMEYKTSSCEEICNDSIELIGYQEYTVNDYSLDCIIEENSYYIVAPKDVVVASPLDTDGRIKWLIEHRKFDEAMHVVRHSDDSSYKQFYVASLYIDHLLEQQQYEEAAKLCLLECGKDRQLWQDVEHKFNKCGQLRSISAYLPTAQNCKLEPQFYEIVLHEYLRLDAVGFLNLIREWPSYLYDTKSIINAVESNFRLENAKVLSESLAILYTHQQDYESALRIYFKLQNKDVFDLICRYNLFSVIHNFIKPLIDLDRERAFQILLNKDNIAPEIVVKKLRDNQEYLYWYLHELDIKGLNNDEEFHRMLVKLYARFDREKLLPFLKRSKRYDIQEALEICQHGLFYREMVYLLGVQLGNTTEALNIIIHNIKDIEMAIEFCKERKDSDLWNVLIDESVNNPLILTKLLDSIIGYVNPQEVVDKIKLGQKIPGLRKSVVKMLCDYRLQVKIQKSSNLIQNSDYFDLHAEVVRQQRRGLSVSHDVRCEKCHGRIISVNSIPSNDVTIFYCGHVYHAKCLPMNCYCSSSTLIEDDDE